MTDYRFMEGIYKISLEHLLIQRTRKLVKTTEVVSKALKSHTEETRADKR